MKETVTEWCPYCQFETTVEWDFQKDGHEIYCPYCGALLMLCGELSCSQCCWDQAEERCQHTRILLVRFRLYEDPDESELLIQFRLPQDMEKEAFLVMLQERIAYIRGKTGSDCLEDVLDQTLESLHVDWAEVQQIEPIEIDLRGE